MKFAGVENIVELTLRLISELDDIELLTLPPSTPVTDFFTKAVQLAVKVSRIENDLKEAAPVTAMGAPTFKRES